MADKKFNHYKWKREYLNEAPMDKSFVKEWEKSCAALMNHMKHEVKKGTAKYSTSDLKYMKNAIKSILSVQDIASNLVPMFHGKTGMYEGENPNGHQNKTVHEYGNGIVEIDSPKEALDKKKRELITGLVENVAMKAIAHFVPTGFSCKKANVEICIKHEEDMDD